MALQTFTLYIPKDTMMSNTMANFPFGKAFRLKGDAVISGAEKRGDHEFWYELSGSPYSVAAQFVVATPEERE